ncbi:MAG: hypothetical protein WKF53_17220 [Rubrobacter sp.]
MGKVARQHERDDERAHDVEDERLPVTLPSRENDRGRKPHQ